VGRVVENHRGEDEECGGGVDPGVVLAADHAEDAAECEMEAADAAGELEGAGGGGLGGVGHGERIGAPDAFWCAPQLHLLST